MECAFALEIVYRTSQLFSYSSTLFVCSISPLFSMTTVSDSDNRNSNHQYIHTAHFFWYFLRIKWAEPRSLYRRPVPMCQR